MEVIAEGADIVIRINDKTVADQKLPAGYRKRGHLVLHHGWGAPQGAGPQAVVEFSKIEVKELPRSERPQLTASAEKARNLLVNGSFEEGPAVGDGAAVLLEKGSTALKGWVVSQGNIDVVDSLFWKAADGKRSLDMNGITAGAISQTFKTRKGQKYRITFDLAAGAPDTEPKDKRLQVSAAGKTTEFTFDSTGKTPVNMGWVSKTWEFTAEADETTLEFLSLTEGNSGPALDDVVVVAIRE
jgi:choice-of-anchor C domain-containing protein